MKFADHLAMLHDHMSTGVPSFVVKVQVYTDKTTSFLKLTAAVPCSVHIDLYSCPRMFCQYLFDHRHTFVGISLLLQQSKNAVARSMISFSAGQLLGRTKLYHWQIGYIRLRKPMEEKQKWLHFTRQENNFTP